VIFLFFPCSNIPVGNAYKRRKQLLINIIAPTTVDAGVWSTALLSKPSLIQPPHIKIVKKV
jgi:hypothetical protein